MARDDGESICGPGFCSTPKPPSPDHRLGLLLAGGLIYLVHHYDQATLAETQAALQIAQGNAAVDKAVAGAAIKAQQQAAEAASQAAQAVSDANARVLQSTKDVNDAYAIALAAAPADKVCPVA